MFEYVKDPGLKPVRPYVKKKYTDIIMIHHEGVPGDGDGDDDDVTAIHKVHIKRGYKAIGYGFVIEEDGTIWLGRGPDVESGGTKDALGYNSHVVDIVFIGNYSENNLPPVMKEAGKRLVRDLIAYFKLAGKGGPIKKILGHKDVDNTQCPGTQFPLAEFKSLLTEPAPAPTPAPTGTYYRVRKSAADVASQKGSFEDLDNAIALAKKNPGYAVFDNAGKQVYPVAQTVQTATGTPYKVRKSWADIASQKGAFKILDNAVTECKKHPGYSVFDSAGKKLYTSPVAPAPVAKTTSPVWVYAEADKESKVVVKLKAGTVMDVLGTVGAFYKVKAAGKTGYVSGNRVKIVSGTAKVPAAVFKLTRNLWVKDPILKGEDIRKVQLELLELGYNLGQWGSDSKYGDATAAAIKDFQRDNGLQVDGWVGEKTCRALGGVWAAK
jgi:hypothetical protein